MRSRPSEAYLAVCRSPDRVMGSSRGLLQVFPSSLEKMTWEFFRRAFSRSRTASCLPSGERMIPGSQRWMSLDP